MAIRWAILRKYLKNKINKNSVINKMWFINILVICFFITNSSKSISAWNNDEYIISQFSVGQEVQEKLSWWFWLRISQVALKMLSRAASSEGLIGVRGSMTKMIHSYDWQLDVHCWQEAPFLSYKGFPIGLLEYLYDMAAGFLQSKWPKRQWNETTFSDNITWEVTHHHF